MGYMPSNEDLLQQWSIWLFGQHGSSDTADDTMGGDRIENENKGKPIWFIPGTWGQVRIPTRTIDVPQGTQLFVVAASSHATSKELLDGEADSEANLTKHANEIDKLWFNSTLALGPVNGDLQKVELDKATTGRFGVDIHASSKYLELTGISSGRTNMVTVGHVHLFTPNPGKTRLVIAAQSPSKKIGKKTEKEYNVQVEYVVTVS